MKRVNINKKYSFLEYRGDNKSIDSLASSILSQIDSIYGVSEDGVLLLEYNSDYPNFNALTTLETYNKYLIVSKQDKPDYILYETEDCSIDDTKSILIDKKIFIAKYCGLANLTLATAPFLNRINRIYAVNTDGTNFVSYRKNSNVNSLTSLRPNQYYLIFSDASSDNPFYFCRDTGFNTANYNNCAFWNGVSGNVTTIGTNGAPSFYGVYDIDGNVSEWVDTIEDSLAKRVYRGGNYSTASAGLLNARNVVDPSYSSNFLGFRICSLYSEIPPIPSLTPTITST